MKSRATSRRTEIVSRSHVNHQALLRRLRSLRNLEFLNIFLLPFVLWLILGKASAATWLLYGSAMGLICWLLVQGTLYWHLKLRALTQKTRTLPAYFVRTFTAFRVINLCCFALFPLLAGYLRATGQIQTSQLVGATLLWFFAILEHINYYHLQLMHDNPPDIRYLIQHKRLRPSPLRSDLVYARNLKSNP